MIDKIIWFWNLVHYNVFIWENRLTNFLLYPFLKLLRSKKIRALYQKRNVSNPDELIKDAILNPEYGTNMMRSFSFMGILIVCAFFGYFFLFQGISGNVIHLNVISALLITGGAYGINYFFLSKDKRSLNYFKEFHEMSLVDKQKFAWISFAFILLIILFLVAGFLVMNKLLNR